MSSQLSRDGSHAQTPPPQTKPYAHDDGFHQQSGALLNMHTANPPFFFNRKKLSFANFVDIKTQPSCLLLCIIFLLIKREETLTQRWMQRDCGKLSRNAPKDTSPRGRCESFIYYLLNVQAYVGIQTRLQFKCSITGWAAAAWVL